LEDLLDKKDLEFAEARKELPSLTDETANKMMDEFGA
jgi:hypothetical protein